MHHGNSQYLHWAHTAEGADQGTATQQGPVSSSHTWQMAKLLQEGGIFKGMKTKVVTKQLIQTFFERNIIFLPSLPRF